eukprot:TRINITY_DN54751_c0_g1_i1.p1 TRINITY_DN54751_c0_g1~~TRINITY_DN54751_c0_g1_i1.p1  ORF type:complete len:209 (-),score=41.89 TRINITY_DN54751_c0_g1_i1:175-801(-)
MALAGGNTGISHAAEQRWHQMMQRHTNGNMTRQAAQAQGPSVAPCDMPVPSSFLVSALSLDSPGGLPGLSESTSEMPGAKRVGIYRDLPHASEGYASAMSRMENLNRAANGNGVAAPRAGPRMVHAAVAADGNFQPPEGEEWHEVMGFLVRISREELDEVLRRAEESPSESGDSSDASTSIGNNDDVADMGDHSDGDEDSDQNDRALL